MFKNSFSPPLLFLKRDKTKIHKTSSRSVANAEIEPTAKKSHRERIIQRARRRERKECLDILNKCAVFGRLDMAAAFIGVGLTPARVQKRLMSERDKAIRATYPASHVSAHHDARMGGGSLVAAMKRRFPEKEVRHG